MGEVLIRPYRAGDEVGIVDCSERNRGASSSLDEWNWRFAARSTGRLITVASRDEKVLAHVGATATRLQIDDHIVNAAAIEEGVVDPVVGDSDARRELLTRMTEMLISRCLESEDLDLAFFFGERDAASEWATVMDGVEVKLPSVGSLRREGSPPSRLRRLAYRAEPARDWEPRLEDLWQRVRSSYPAAIIRDPEHALARYAGRPSLRYHRFLVFPRFSAGAVAYAVFGCDKGLCRWVDLVWDHKHPGALVLLSHISSRLAQQTGAGTEEIWLTGDLGGRAGLADLGFVEQSPAKDVGMSICAATVETGRVQSLSRLFATSNDLRSR